MRMKYALFPVMLLCITVMQVTAQQADSTRFDIGYLTLNRAFTQHITIRGEDLEKMPFVNLSDALSAWLYGAFTQPARVAYVVDGNPVTDVNVYPIYEIEEVTLIEQAAGAAAYGGTQQELVVITTKRGKGPGNLRATAQGGLVNADGNGNHTFNRAYLHYYFSSYANTDKLSFGVSEDFIKDVEPEDKGNQDQVKLPFQLDRWRFNGYFQWRPAKGDEVEFRLNYAPQTIGGKLDSAEGSSTNEGQQQGNAHLLIPQLRWKAELAPGLTNEFRAVYAQTSGNYSYTGTITSLGGAPLYYGELYNSKVGQTFVRDRIGYTASWGDWHFAPALNISYTHIDEQLATGVSKDTVGANGALVTYPAVLGPTTDQKKNLLFFTPAVELYWRKGIDLQVGAQLDASSPIDSAAKRFFPFASLGVDVLHLGRRSDGAALKLFGSYARRATVMTDDYSLVDFSGGGAPYTLHGEPIYYAYASPVTQIELPIPRIWPSGFWTGELGATYTTANGRLQLQYNFERRNFGMPGNAVGITNPGYNYDTVGTLEWRSVQHHGDVRFLVVDTKSLRWQTGLNVTLLRSTLRTGGAYVVYYPKSGDYNGAPFSWTGGWVNRLTAGRFTAGLDLLYHFHETVPNYGSIFGSPTTKLNSVVLPNVYLAYRWKPVEFFLESRGLVRSKNNDLLDDRRFYTVGGNLSW